MMMLFLFLIALVFTPIVHLINTVRMFMRDMWTLMDLHRVWFR
jgi:succinate dehydrogenase/fumarate reductase cytochrome b subunit